MVLPCFTIKDEKEQSSNHGFLRGFPLIFYVWKLGYWSRDNNPLEFGNFPLNVQTKLFFLTFDMFSSNNDMIRWKSWKMMANLWVSSKFSHIFQALVGFHVRHQLLRPPAPPVPRLPSPPPRPPQWSPPGVVEGLYMDLLSNGLRDIELTNH